MYNPCFECWNRRGHSYTEECDNTCLYAKDIKNRDTAINLLLDAIEEEHMGMRGIMTKEIKNLFGVDV